LLKDPLFIISLLGMGACLAVWIKDTLTNNESDHTNFLVENLSYISTSFGLLMLFSIFQNAGDLGIVLLFGSLISLIVLIVGIAVKNQEIISSSRGYFIPLFIIFILRTFLYEPYQIPSGSMMPGLKVGDFLLVDKHSYGLKVNRVGEPFALTQSPDYGDVVVFIPSNNPVPYVKRLIGKPGDSIRIIDKKIFINGTPVNKTYLKTEKETITKRFRNSSGQIFSRDKEVVVDYFTETLGNKSFVTRNIRDENIQYPSEWTVPPGHYFVMGDNRDNSNDSTKDVGFVPRENFFGTASHLFMTWECWTCIPHFSRTGKIN
jgi:signal peptidase I